MADLETVYATMKTAAREAVEKVLLNSGVLEEAYPDDEPVNHARSARQYADLMVPDENLGFEDVFFTMGGGG